MFCDIEGKLNDPLVRHIISCSLFDQSAEGVDKALKKYPGEQFFAWIENGEPLGICGFRPLQDKVEICHIAVVEHARGRGIGNSIVTALREKYAMALEAETDDDAVGFYRKCGFGATVLYKYFCGQKYRRYTCVLPAPGTNN